MGIFDKLFGGQKKREEEARLLAEQEARQKAEEASRIAAAQAKLEEEEKQKADEALRIAAAQVKQEEEVRLAAEQIAKIKAEELKLAEESSKKLADAKAKLEEEAKIAAEKTALEKEAQRLKIANEIKEKAIIEQEAKLAAEQIAKVKIEELKLAEESSKKLADAKAKLEEETKVAAEKTAREKEARLKAEQEAKQKAEEASRIAAEQAKQEEEARLLTEQQAKQHAEEASRIAAEQAKQKEEAKLLTEQEAKQQAEEASRIAAEQAKQKGEAKLKAEQEAQQKAEEASRIAVEQAKQKEEAKLKAEQEAQQKAEEASRIAVEQAKQEKEARLKAEQEAKQQAEEASRIAASQAKQEEEARQLAEQEAKQKSEKASRIAAEQAKQKEEVRLIAEQEAKSKNVHPEEKKGLFNRFFSKDKLDKGLEKTKESVFSKLSRAIVGKSRVDDEVLDNLEEVLITSDVGVDTTIKIIGRIEQRISKDKYLGTSELNRILKEEISNLLEENNANNELGYVIPDTGNEPYVIMVVGVNGVGKTTTIGKLAYQFKKMGKSVVLGAADTFRAAAVDQLIIWSERVGVPIVQQGMNADPASVAFDTLQSAKAKNADVVIIDTAGRLHNKVNLMNELSKIKNVMKKVVPTAPHEILLVLDGSTGQNAFEQATQFTKATEINALALTKLDGTAKGGVVIGISEQFKIPVKYIGIGEGMEDLQLFNKTEFVDSLFK